MEMNFEIVALTFIKDLNLKYENPQNAKCNDENTNNNECQIITF